MIKAIETIYNNYHFRSRLEARWAVFFDALGIEYRYETEGFDLAGIWYLPDFYLPHLKAWIEIKPELPTKEDREKAIRLCLGTQELVAIFAGDVWFNVDGFGFQVLQRNCLTYVGQLIQDNQVTMHSLSKDEIIICKDRQIAGIDFDRNYTWSKAMWVECDECNYININTLGNRGCRCEKAKNLSNTTDNLSVAYITARQARFEHGEKPISGSQLLQDH